MEAARIGRGEANVCEPAQPNPGIENTDDNVLAVHRWHYRDAHVDRSLRCIHADRAILRQVEALD